MAGNKEANVAIQDRADPLIRGCKYVRARGHCGAGPASRSLPVKYSAEVTGRPPASALILVRHPRGRRVLLPLSPVRFKLRRRG